MTEPTVLTPAEVAEILARAEKATPGPHQTRFVYRMIHAMREHGLRLGLMMGPDTGLDWADADLWANSQADINALCATITRLRGLIEGMGHEAECDSRKGPTRTGLYPHMKIEHKCNCIQSQVNL